ncbi:MAG: flagellar hook capping FlgD N-terminal domain-containing protein [Armatimonadota bacterium]|nr:hypothetical protein [bacterium]
MSSTNAVSGSDATSNNTSTTATTTTKALDQDAFLKLLICEMQNQDPMNPMDGKDSIAQLAQFSSLEQMEQMSTSMDKFTKSAQTEQAVGMTGKWIDYQDPDDSTKTITGVVDYAVVEDGVAKLVVGEDKITLDSVLKVYPDSSSLSTAQNSQRALGMIGQTVDYVDPSNPFNTLTGKVTGVSFVSNRPKLVINSQNIDLDNIVKVNEDTVSNEDAVAIATAMKGMKIDYTDRTDSTKILSGTVQSVSTDGDTPQLKVGSEFVDLSQIVKVYK